MNASKYFDRFQRDGRAYLGTRWLIRVARRLVLCRNAKKFPAVRFVGDEEDALTLFRSRRRRRDDTPGEGDDVSDSITQLEGGTS